MTIRVLLLGVPDAASQVLAEEGAGAGVVFDVAQTEEDAVRLTADPSLRYEAAIAPVWDIASGVAKRLVARDGRIALHAAPPEGAPEAARKLVQIIAATARARAERQEMLLAMVAHDVRAPIGVALGALSELGHPSLGALDAEQKALVKLASRSLQRLLRTAQNISLLARVDAGRLELSKAPADLAALVREAALRLEQAGELGEVKLELQTTSAPVHVDRERVAAALDNVLSNAARFARRRIELHVASDAGGAAVTVEDDGPGLPAGMVDPFDRVSAALASPSKTGSGFGLMVVRGILAAHGGNARAENRVDAGQVRGARFILQLPSS